MQEINMKKLRILLDEETLRISKLHTISGKFCVQVGDHFFPSEQWDDLCADVLSMWLLSINKLMLDCEKSIVCHFMDGDYAFRLTKHNKAEATIFFLAQNEECIFKEEISVPYFARQILSAASKVINHYPQYGGNKTIAELERLSDALRITLNAYCGQ